jgi:tRNA-Thr(GGU) m(6)t(6)A37 methyltransferase TsaA
MRSSLTPPYSIQPVGFVRSNLRHRNEAPKQGHEGAPEAWIEVSGQFVEGLQGIAAGQQIIVITWLHQGSRDTLKVHPRRDPGAPLTGVFATRSPDRPNPLGLHRVKVREVAGNRIRVAPLEALDGTPVVDIKPVLVESPDY